jgi:hypothetical protein
MTLYERRARPVMEAERSMYSTERIDLSRVFALRLQLQNHYAFAVPNEEAIAALVELSPIVEIGAGRGYWGWEVRQRGGEIECYDLHPGGAETVGGRSARIESTRTYTTVRKGPGTVAGDYPDRTLMLCWPDDYNQEKGWSDRAVETYLEAGGETVVFVGEGRHGCTGSNRLFDLLETLDRVQTVNIPSFDGIGDQMYVYRR